MKRIWFAFFALPLILSSCVEYPEAEFYASEIEVEVGETVYFYNTSYNAHFYEWDFGDGSYSNYIDAEHRYQSSGTFEVVLRAENRNGNVDYAYQEINVVYPTTLEITVEEYYDGYVVPGARVRLYPTRNDWDLETNMIVEGYTGQNGKVVFSGLGPFVYYVDVYEDNHDNYTIAQELPQLIRTQQLLANEINQFTALVDYYTTTKKSGGEERPRTGMEINRKRGERN